MKRSRMHSGFAAASLLLTMLTGAQWFTVTTANGVAGELARIPASRPAGDEPVPAAAKRGLIGLAWANAFSAGGDFERAEDLFNYLIQQRESAAIAQAAQFNLANMYLRQAIQPQILATRARPLLELAKQRYRDLLAEVPQHWDARYNLARALRLAPETADTAAYDKGKPIKSVRVIVPDFKAKDLP